VDLRFDFDTDSYLLFTNSEKEFCKKKTFTPNMLKDALTRIYGCSCDILRHSYVSHLFDTGKLKSMSQLKNTAKGMRHSVVELLQYRKISDDA
jgi:hypothetical protein